MLPILELEAKDAYALWARSYPPQAHNALMCAEERAMLAWLPQSLHGNRVLDAGCGSGRYLLHARQRGATILGVDTCFEMLCGAATRDLPVALGDLLRLPLVSAWADLVLCALTLGHIPALAPPLIELARVLRPGGTALCSELHPLGTALGWQRTFESGGRRYAVRHVAHHYADWHRACRIAGFSIEDVIEPRLDPADIPAGARFDPRALEMPVIIGLKLRKRSL
jgi:malonyl-CoA O-methyltransferase